MTTYTEFRPERADKMRAALLAIIAKLEGRDKPLTNEIRQIARDGLGIVTGPGISSDNRRWNTHDHAWRSGSGG